MSRVSLSLGLLRKVQLAAVQENANQPNFNVEFSSRISMSSFKVEFHENIFVNINRIKTIYAHVVAFKRIDKTRDHCFEAPKLQLCNVLFLA
jgi:hypothetical protein